MPNELMERLFAEFKNDKHRWDEFAKREFSEAEVEELPGRAEIVEEFVREKLGRDHGFMVASIIIKIRKDMHGYKDPGPVIEFTSRVFRSVRNTGRAIAGLYDAVRDPVLWRFLRAWVRAWWRARS
jgi:hypothetical protein